MAFLNWVAKLLVFAFLITGIVFNIMVLLGCDILSVKNQDVYLGLFSLEVRGGGCIDYPEYQQTEFAVLHNAAENPFMRTAQAGSIGGLCFGILTLLFLVLDQFFCRVPGARCLTSMCFFGAQVGSALVFFIYMGEYCDNGRGCKWQDGATEAVIACAAYVFGSLFTGCMGDKLRENWEEKRRERNPERYQEEAPSNDPKKYRW